MQLILEQDLVFSLLMQDLFLACLQRGAALGTCADAFAFICLCVWMSVGAAQACQL